MECAFEMQSQYTPFSLGSDLLHIWAAAKGQALGVSSPYRMGVLATSKCKERALLGNLGKGGCWGQSTLIHAFYFGSNIRAVNVPRNPSSKPLTCTTIELQKAWT